MSQTTFVKSAFILTIASLLSKILGSIFRIPLQNIAGDEVLGIFSLVYPVYMVALFLSVAGIPTAISKLIAEARAINNQGNIREIYTTASILSLFFGVISFAIIYFFSTPIANALGGPETRVSLIIVSATLIIAPYMAVYRGYFQGFEDMRPTGISQVIEQFIRVALILIMAYILVSAEASTEVISGGVMVGSVLGALASLIYLRMIYARSSFKVKKITAYTLTIFKKWSKQILQVSIPIAIGSITMALLNFIDSFTVPLGLRQAGVSTEKITYLYGIFSRGTTLVQIVTVFASSIVMPLIPAITKKMLERDLSGTRSIIERSYYLTHFISWPAALELVALTFPLNLSLFTNLEGSMVLAITEFSSVFTSLVLLGTGVLQGIGLANISAFIIILGVVLKIIINPMFIRISGLDGAAWATLTVYFVLFLTNSMIINKHLKLILFNKQIGKIILASVIMGAVIGIPTLFFDLSEWTRLQALGYIIIAIIFGAIIYFLQLFLYKGIDRKEIQTLLKKTRTG